MLKVRGERRSQRPSRSMAPAIETGIRLGPPAFSKKVADKFICPPVAALPCQFVAFCECEPAFTTTQRLRWRYGSNAHNQKHPPPTPTDHQGLSRSAQILSARLLDPVLRPGSHASDELPSSYAYQSLPLAYEWSILMDRPLVSLTSAAYTLTYQALCGSVAIL